MPFSVGGVEAGLRSRLRLDGQRSNDAFQFYRSASVSLSGGRSISNADLRIKRTSPYPAFLVLKLAGSCVTAREVREHYAELRITHVPSGRSPDETTTYSAQASWGRLSLVFKVANSNCVDFVAFDPVELQ